MSWYVSSKGKLCLLWAQFAPRWSICLLWKNMYWKEQWITGTQSVSLVTWIHHLMSSLPRQLTQIHYLYNGGLSEVDITTTTLTIASQELSIKDRVVNGHRVFSPLLNDHVCKAYIVLWSDAHSWYKTVSSQLASVQDSYLQEMSLVHTILKTRSF